MGKVDPAFVQDPEHRPKLFATEGNNIPLIDLLSVANNSNGPEAIEKVVREVGSACKESGFFQVVNHGVPSETRQRLETVSRKFFALPLEEKRKVSRDEVNTCGYYNSEHTKNIRDWKEVFDFVVEDPAVLPASPHPEDKDLTLWSNRWPQYPPEISN